MDVEVGIGKSVLHIVNGCWEVEGVYHSAHRSQLCFPFAPHHPFLRTSDVVHKKQTSLVWAQKHALNKRLKVCCQKLY